jgi:cyclopropane-fatty-acyl-phospholipid synthase
MEQLAKQSNPPSMDPLSVNPVKHNRYRTVIHHLLAQMKDARIELVEAHEARVFGDSSASLVGQIIVHDEGFYKDVVFRGSIGAAEAYLQGKWTSPHLTQVIQVMARNQSQLDVIDNKTRWLSRVKNWWLVRQTANTEAGSKRNILAHYDIGNELYQRFLDPDMQYSSAIYGEHAADLDSAQQNKMQIICDRLALTASDRVIEIGTGWGGLAIYMAQHIGCHVTTTTISDAQYSYAQQRVNQLGLGDRITLLKKDYRQLTGQYDKLVSIEMIEAVGHNYMATFFNTCSSLLKPSGRMLLQSITIADGRYEQYRQNQDFIQRYIFPGGCLPSIAVMSQHIASQTDMVLDEVHDIGLHYARTLHDWQQRFEARWSELMSLGYSDEFKRLWQFYLSYCEGAFIERVISTHHLVARKPRYIGAQDETVLDY